MNYVYKNITTTSPQILIKKDDGGVTTIHKCQIANVDSSDATVGIYIEDFNELDSFTKINSLEWRSIISDANFTFEFIKSVIHVH